MAAATASSDLLRTTEPATLAASALPFLSSTLRQFKTSSNSSIFGASDNVAIDLLMVLPRFAQKAASFAFVTVPEQMGNYGLLGGEYARYLNSSFGRPSPPVEEARTEVWRNGTFDAMAGFQSVRGFGGVFSYITSPWAILCLFMAIALNRTQIYASLRRPLVLSWPVRLTLRVVPVMLFLIHITKLLQAIRCQTSPDYPLLRYNNATMHVNSDFTMDGGALYRLSSNLLFYQSDRDSCAALGMIPNKDNEPIKGSLSLLWPLFQSLCLSQFIETLSCAVQARPVQAEMGMTIFEQSLAFAESEAMASNKVGWGPFGFPPFIPAEVKPMQSAASKAVMMAKLNTPPEVLFIALISSMNHLTSHILGVFGWQGRFRLINSGIWGICFMAAFIWSVSTGGNDLETGLLRFPTVCIVGFIPHLLILIGIAICAIIYAIALTLSTISPPQGYQQLGLSLRERLALAHENLQANVQLSSLRISMHEEFYTTLLKIGFVALTAASEAVYLNEGRAVEIQRWTWLDEERMREVNRQRQRTPWVPPALLTDRADSIAQGVGLVEELSPGISFMQGWVSPYQRERKTQRLRPKKDRQRGQTRPEGTGQWVLAWEFLRGIFWLMVSWNASAILRVMAGVGIPWRPRLLTRLDSLPKEPLRRRMPSNRPLQAQAQPFVMMTPDGRFSRWDETTDVESEMRLQLARNEDASDLMEAKVDKALYTWWLNGGYWGSEDNSADWAPSEDDDNDDATSVITTATESEWEDLESDTEEGRRTPTQVDFTPGEPELADFATFDANKLASLLDPKSVEDRREARILARHLTSSIPLTRSAFAKDEARILLSPSARRQAGLAPMSQNRPLNQDEEGILLEQILLSSRFKNSGPQVAPTGSSWEAGAPGLGSSGPQCVVCQSSPRTIIIWPCRCLALCEDCRVSLAMNNFATCVCCRRDVVAFSRIFVP